MKVVLLSIFSSLFSVLLAAATIGNVEKVVGSVKVKSEGSFKKSKIGSGHQLKEGDLVSTSKSGSAVINLTDGSSVVLSASSSIHFPALSSAEQVEGKIYYKITSRDAKNALKVKTPFAIIGIKGTTFVINSDEGKEGVALKEGLIGVQSLKEEFALYRKEVLAQYNAYVSEQMSEFEKYKNGGKKPEPEMTKQFDLKAGNVISFNGNEVKESAWNEKDDAEFAAFEKMITEGFSQELNKASQVIEDAKATSDEFSTPTEEKANEEGGIYNEMKESMKF